MPYTSPSTVILCSIPKCAINRLAALCYYVRQHLAAVFVTPNYADTNEENAFKDYTEINPQPVAEGSLYLYLPTKQAGKLH